MNTTDIKDVVKQKYGEAALRVTTGGSSCCGASPGAGGCDPITGYDRRDVGARNHPSGAVRPEALEQLESAHISAAGLRSKSWEEFSAAGAPKLDFVFTVCDNAAKEVCPIWPGLPMSAHWGVPDPAAVQGTQEEIRKSFRDAFFMLDRRISLFLSLPLASIDGMALKKELDNIGRQ